MGAVSVGVYVVGMYAAMHSDGWSYACAAEIPQLRHILAHLAFWGILAFGQAYCALMHAAAGAMRLMQH